MANIIIDDKLNIRTTQFKNDELYSFSDLFFYVSDRYNNYGVYLIVSNTNNVSDIIQLDYYNCANGYKIYTINYNKKTRIQSGDCKISILLLDNNISQCYTSQSMNVNINIENYQLSHQLCITKEISQTIDSLYNKIIELTNMNINLYEKIENEVNNK